MILINVPVSEIEINSITNYNDYSDYIKDFARNHQIEFIDFNLVRPECFDTNDKRLYKDPDHLNGYGATLFTELLCRIQKGEISVDDVLYSSLEEKKKLRQPMVYGISDLKKGNNDTWKIVSNRDDLLYKVSLERDNNIITIQDFSTNKIINYELKTGDTITINTSNKTIERVIIKIGE